ncbi:hypothetical protein IFM89_010253 [Coptis chinensis]|uniref:Uncharacterized protein n=1 Tax=Coptis chinensis TaxID=261450 RepID=A0A835IC01_9MAGN|nr:hypothetical protein IFM89_010253 [Coptis chinensis]
MRSNHFTVFIVIITCDGAMEVSMVGILIFFGVLQQCKISADLRFQALNYCDIGVSMVLVDGGTLVDLLIGEPFYYENEGKLPWQNLRFWKERTMFDSVLSEDVVIMPCKGVLKACAMSLPDLWKSRSCLARVEGFNHSIVNATLGACSDGQISHEAPCIPYFIWQCGEIKELSEIFTVMEFDFTKPIGPCFGKAKVNFNVTGICHGFTLWIDWVMDAKSSTVLSTGPDCRYYKQGVKFLSKPVVVDVNGVCSSSECPSADLETSFDPSNGELTINYLFHQ